MTGPRFDDLDVYETPAALPAEPFREGWLEVVLSPPSLYIYTAGGGHQLVAASTPTTPATPASEGGQGISEMMWSTRYEVDYGLRWDHKRQVWAAADGFAYGMPEKVGEGAS
jgi:hypothetical protein